MTAGRPLAEIVAELERRRQPGVTRDFTADTRSMRYDAADADRDTPTLGFVAGDPFPADTSFPLTPYADTQLVEWALIGKHVAASIRNAGGPALVEQCISARFDGEGAAIRLVRILDGHVRAFLPAGYRRLDDYALLTAVAPVLQSAGVGVVASDLTERRLYVHAVSERLAFEVRDDEPWHFGIVVRGSEVGAGGVGIDPVLCGPGGEHPIIFARPMSLASGAFDTEAFGSGNVTELPASDAADDPDFWERMRERAEGELSGAVPSRTRTWVEAAAEIDAPYAASAIAKNAVGLTAEVTAMFGVRLLERLGKVRGGAPTLYDCAIVLASFAADAPDSDAAYEIARSAARLVMGQSAGLRSQVAPAAAVPVNAPATKKRKRGSA